MYLIIWSIAVVALMYTLAADDAGAHACNRASSHREPRAKCSWARSTPRQAHLRRSLPSCQQFPFHSNAWTCFLTRASASNGLGSGIIIV